MNTMIKTKVILLSILLLTGCEQHNSRPTYGETGLPKIVEQLSKQIWI